MSIIINEKPTESAYYFYSNINLYKLYLHNKIINKL